MVAVAWWGEISLFFMVGWLLSHAPFSATASAPGVSQVAGPIGPVGGRNGYVVSMSGDGSIYAALAPSWRKVYIKTTLGIQLAAVNVTAFSSSLR